MELRDYVLREEGNLYPVLESSSDPHHRAVAAVALGYARKSDHQIQALVNACRDPDDSVRNNAVRALIVLAHSNSDIARRIPADSFIPLLASGVWTDRNKASGLIEALTKDRDPKVLEQLRSKALAPLLETARWQSRDHAFAARMIIGRIAGLEEDRLTELANAGQVEQIVNSLSPAE